MPSSWAWTFLLLSEPVHEYLYVNAPPQIETSQYWYLGALLPPLACNSAPEQCKIKFRGGQKDVKYQKHFSLFKSGTSVTRLGDILDFGQLFKAFGNN